MAYTCFVIDEEATHRNSLNVMNQVSIGCVIDKIVLNLLTYPSHSAVENTEKTVASCACCNNILPHSKEITLDSAQIDLNPFPTTSYLDISTKGVRNLSVFFVPSIRHEFCVCTKEYFKVVLLNDA